MKQIIFGFILGVIVFDFLLFIFGFFNSPSEFRDVDSRRENCKALMRATSTDEIVVVIGKYDSITSCGTLKDFENIQSKSFPPTHLKIK